jgi:hypothetical protein
MYYVFVVFICFDITINLFRDRDLSQLTLYCLTKAVRADPTDLETLAERCLLAQELGNKNAASFT